MLSLTDKQNIVVDCFINAIPSVKSRIPKRHYRLYAWRPGSDDEHESPFKRASITTR
jgi:hypothetical protein